jgi:hypothetical protein
MTTHTHLEVGIGEQEEELSQLALGEVVGDVFHGVGAQACAVVVLVRGASQRQDALLHILTHLLTQTNTVSHPKHPG